MEGDRGGSGPECLNGGFGGVVVVIIVVVAVGSFSASATSGWSTSSPSSSSSSSSSAAAAAASSFSLACCSSSASITSTIEVDPIPSVETDIINLPFTASDSFDPCFKSFVMISANIFSEK